MSYINNFEGSNYKTPSYVGQVYTLLNLKDPDTFEEPGEASYYTGDLNTNEDCISVENSFGISYYTFITSVPTSIRIIRKAVSIGTYMRFLYRLTVCVFYNTYSKYFELHDKISYSFPSFGRFRLHRIARHQ